MCSSDGGAIGCGKGRVGDGIGVTMCSSDGGAIGSGKGRVGSTI